MAEKKFHITRYQYDSESGSWKQDGVRKSLEDDFGAIRYKSMTGINSRGKQKGVYTESYAEADSLRVHVDGTAKEESVSSTLSVCVFGTDPDSHEDIDVTEQILNAENSWHSFYDFLEGCLVLWYDDYRQRKGLFFVNDSCEPKTDNIKGVPYLQCDIKLTNVFGRTFGTDDNMIEDWLKNGGKEVRR